MIPLERRSREIEAPRWPLLGVAGVAVFGSIIIATRQLRLSA